MQGLPSEGLGDAAPDGGDAGRAADQHHPVDVGRLEVCVASRPSAAVDRPVDEVRGRGVHRSPVDLGDAGTVRQRQFDPRKVALGEHSLGALGALEQRRDRLGRRGLVGGEPEALDEEIRDAPIEVVAAEPGVAARRDHLGEALAQAQDRDVEGAAAKVVDRDRDLVLLVEPVGEGGRGRLVHQAEHVESCEAAGVAGRLPLAVVEIGGNGDDGSRDLLAEGVLGAAFEFAQDQRGNLDRRDLGARRGVAFRLEDDREALGILGEAVSFAVGRIEMVAAESHEAFHGEDAAARMERCAAPRTGTDEEGAVGEQGHRGRKQWRTGSGIRDDRGSIVAHDGNQAVGRPEVDSDDEGHGRSDLQRGANVPLERAQIREFGEHLLEARPPGRASRVGSAVDRPGEEHLLERRTPFRAAPGDPGTVEIDLGAQRLASGSARGTQLCELLLDLEHRRGERRGHRRVVAAEIPAATPQPEAAA